MEPIDGLIIPCKGSIMRQDILITYIRTICMWRGGGGGGGSYMCVRMLSVCHVHGWARATKLTDLFRIPLSPRASCTSLTDMALGRSCLLANTNTTASRNSSSWSYIRTQVKENERNPMKQDYTLHKTLLH